MARPSEYTVDRADAICSQLAEGRSLRSVCKDEGMPDVKTVFNWLRKYPDFEKAYVRAKEESADALTDEMLDICDDASNDWMESNDPENPGYRVNKEHINRSRLRVDTRKWLASKLKPKRYGEKIAVGGDPDAPPIQTVSRIELVPLSDNRSSPPPTQAD